MGRAAILIGVNKTGGLPALSDAVTGAKAMAVWAKAQGMAEVHCFTDDSGPVVVADIRKAIRAIIEEGTTEQLIIYFAGHGVNNNYAEYWLLSDAPIDDSAAINLESSSDQARHAGIPHVVFISDACRTAAAGIQNQRVTGSNIFPNDPVPGPEQAVDIFFATTLGRPALELADPSLASANFKAVYTAALLDAVSGNVPEAVTPLVSAGQSIHVVRPRTLKVTLAAQLPLRIKSLGFAPTVSQIPDARITSGDDAWLARLNTLPVPRSPSPTRGGPAAPQSSPVPTPQEQAARAIGELLRNEARTPSRGPSRGGPASPGPGSPTRGGTPYSARVPGWSKSFPGLPLATGNCGIVVQGSGIADCLGIGRVGQVSADAQAAVVPLTGTATEVLITFTDGSAALLPAIRDFVILLSVDNGELADVSYLGPETSNDDGAAALRSTIAVAARNGTLRLDRDLAKLLAERMAADTQIDLSLALYAAYAFYDQQMTASIRQLSKALKDQASISLFDISLLAGELNGVTLPQPGYHPGLPMLARAWALLPAAKISVTDELRDIKKELLPSLWSHFNPTGAQRLRAYISTWRQK